EAPDQHSGIDTQAGLHVTVSKPALDANYELQRAYNALMSGNSDAAIGIYQEVLESDPHNEQALFGLATTYHRAGQLEKARPLYMRLLKINPGHREGLNNFLALAADEAPEEALNELQNLQKRSPDFSPIPAQMAVIYQKMNRLDEAIQYMSRAASLAPENMTYRYNLAILFDKAHHYPEAAALYRQVLDAGLRGETVPGDLTSIQQRLTFISSNRS
ncbi:MAG: tetratricopeptide repeat protein, partial [Alphaproteobacteria bacterium]|nr:tetratricopeptide repeat protein [Alphaproteobacteria bacterium]